MENITRWLDQFDDNKIKDFIDRVDDLCMDCILGGEESCEECVIRKFVDECYKKLETRMESVHDTINYKALQNVINENFRDDPAIEIDKDNILINFMDVCHTCEIYNPECGLMCDKCPVGMMVKGIKKLEGAT